jgi:hypothetical protein
MKMKYLLALVVLLVLCSTARADTLQLFTDQVQLGQPYGIQLCDIRCITTPYGPPDILAQVEFVDTGVPAAEFFAASDPNVDLLIAYLINPDPPYQDLLRTIADSNYFAGHFADYPIEGDSVVTGMLFQIDGSGNASYSVTGTNLVPEPGTMLLLAIGLVGTLAIAAILQ